MFIENLLSKLYKCKQWYNYIILILICFLIAISYLHGKPYAHCYSIYPDEIMDFQYSILQSSSRLEENISFESRDDIKFINSFFMQIFYIHDICTPNACLFVERSHQRNFKKRLFLLQRYNS